MRRLLTFAEAIAGTAARHRVFEPLLADWQRELLIAKRRGAVQYLRTIAAGSFAFMRAVFYCAMIDGVWIPPLRVTVVALIAIIAAVGMSVAVLLIAPLPLNSPRDPSDPMLQRWILNWANTIVPPAFVLATFLLRRDTRANVRHAVVVTLLAAAATTALVFNTTDDALWRRFDTFELQERMRARALERHRAGQLVFSGTRYQETLRTTLAERRANFDRYHARIAAVRSMQPPPTWRERLAQLQPVLLAAIFAIMGWILAGVGNASVARAFGWWALVFAATITLTRILWLVVQVPMPKIPQWMMPATFVSITFALAINAIRSRKFSS